MIPDPATEVAPAGVGFVDDAAVEQERMAVLRGKLVARNAERLKLCWPILKRETRWALKLLRQGTAAARKRYPCYQTKNQRPHSRTLNHHERRT